MLEKPGNDQGDMKSRDVLAKSGQLATMVVKYSQTDLKYNISIDILLPELAIISRSRILKHFAD